MPPSAALRAMKGEWMGKDFEQNSIGGLDKRTGEEIFFSNLLRIRFA
ncbi:MAG: hypothetical protein ACKO2G_09660 [Verrucomicrobiales bacterium]